MADPAILDRVKADDRVKFKAGLVNGRFAVKMTPVVKRKQRR